jgi:hypothetical protein
MIYLIITTCIINKFGGVVNHNHRKQTYLKNITKTLNLLTSLSDKIKPIIVENNGQRQTYLDQLNCDVLYTQNNENKYDHKGVNELLDIKEVINKYNINDDDIIIKLTGRYYPLNNHFFNLVLNNQDKDALICFFNVCELKYMEYDCVLGFFAMRCKYLKIFEYKDFTKSPEVEFATYVKNNIESFVSVEKLNLRCCFADNLRILDV